MNQNDPYIYDREGFGGFDDLGEAEVRQWSYEAARAVLEANKEPSIAMLAAGMEQGPIGCCILEGGHAHAIWQAMIDAILTPC